MNLDSKENHQVTMDIVDMTGRTVMSQRITLGAGQNSTIDMSSYAAGQYTLVLSGETTLAEAERVTSHTSAAEVEL